jgi:peroxiredoxin
MNQWAKSQRLKNVKVIPYGAGEFTRRVGMLVRKDNLGFALRSWRYAAVVNDGMLESWFEEPIWLITTAKIPTAYPRRRRF